MNWEFQLNPVHVGTTWDQDSGGDLSYWNWKKEGELSNPRGSGPPSVTPSIPPRSYQNPSDSSPHYLPISGLAPPLDRAEMKGFSIEREEQREMRMKRGKQKTIHTWFPLIPLTYLKQENVRRNEKMCHYDKKKLKVSFYKIRATVQTMTVTLNVYSLLCE